MTFDLFLQEICPSLDLEWRKYRHRSARHHVDARMRELAIDGYGGYRDLIRTDGQEAALLPDLMRVTVSRFFREQKHWQTLKTDILPELIASKCGSGAIRIWSAGCCGGEEPFTMALLWLEYMLPLFPGCSMDILATDIDDASIERARLALYRRETLREVPAEVRRRWFNKVNALWRLDAKVTSLVRFEKKNLICDPPPLVMDLAFCRYLAFTYFRGDRLRTAIQRLWDSLCPGGILMIGQKETFPASAMELFEPLPGSEVFFRKKP